MAGLKTFVAAALISAISATPALADEPAAFEAQYPNRDPLNRGELTPAGRLGLENPGGARGSSSFPAQSYQSGEPATGALPGHRRRHPSR